MDPRTEKMLAERAQKMAAIPPPLRRPVSAVNDARRWAKTNTPAMKILAGVVAAVLVGAYYLFVSLPAERLDQEQIKARAAENLKAETNARQDKVLDCLTTVQTEADARWNAACKALHEGEKCPLPERQAQAFERDESDARNSCLIRFGNKKQ